MTRSIHRHSGEGASVPGELTEDAHSPRELAALFPNMGVTSCLE